ncbi:Site-specific recombinase XerD [Nocardia amikacinitolerans]|uniref:tyrosine-type recombinase/integrase n=1 Tax=Nocardia amikacinitolerans TaxID=756689 RepID=UPI0020A51632|nr:site-specific integrase [Nocardia amikacinitolerans]MCP2297946.1 Site-specific recombinase XerD [Nocardia amikacinitolerans]
MTRPAPAEVSAAMVLLRRLGIAPEDLVDAAANSVRAVPTFAEYIPKVIAAMPAGGTRANYVSYWNKLLAREDWRDRPIDEPTVTEFRQLIAETRAARVLRSNSRDGSAGERLFITALRRLYQFALEDGLIDPHHNPAARLKRPRNLRSSRHALPSDLLASINTAAATTGHDPELDVLLLRLHTETACRRAGALALRPQDLDRRQCLIRLREKGGTQRWQPVSPTLMHALIHHADRRGAAPAAPLLRNRRGRPISRGRYDQLWQRIARHVPEVAIQGITTHWLRHTTLTWVERSFGHAVARAYAGHTDANGEGSTILYTRAGIEEVARALAALTAEPHPLAPDR